MGSLNNRIAAAGTPQGKWALGDGPQARPPLGVVPVAPQQQVLGDRPAVMDILAGAKNAPRIKMLPGDLSGLPEAVRRTFEGTGADASFFPAYTPAMQEEQKRLEAEGATGFYNPTEDEVYIRPGMDPATERFTAYHEVAGHYGLAGAMGDDYSEIMSRARENPTIARLAEAMRIGSTDYEVAANTGEANDPRMHEEALAELAAAQRTGDYNRIERDWGVRIPTAQRSGFRGTLARVVQMTKRKLADLTGDEPHAFNDEQVERLIRNAWKYVQKPRPQAKAKTDDAAVIAAMDAAMAADGR